MDYISDDVLVRASRYKGNLIEDEYYSIDNAPMPTFNDGAGIALSKFANINITDAMYNLKNNSTSDGK